MKSILYVIVATALISITPFLISFNPECVPLRGIMIYSILIILLIFTNIKEHFPTRKGRIIVFALTYILVAMISLMDTHAIVQLLKLSSAYYLIPLATTAFALLILKDLKKIPFKQINLLLFSSLFLHFVLFNIADGQPLLTFTLFNLF